MADPIEQLIYEKYGPQARQALNQDPYLRKIFEGQKMADNLREFKRPGGGFALTNAEPAPLIPALAGAAGRIGGGVIGGMAIPSQTGMEPGEQFMGQLDQQGSALGGPKISEDELSSMIQGLSNAPNPAAPKEEYPGLVDEDMGSQTNWSEGASKPKRMKSDKPRSAMSPKEVDELVYEVHGADTDEEAVAAADFVKTRLPKGKKRVEYNF